MPLLEFILPFLTKTIFYYLEKKQADEKTKKAYRDLVIGLSNLQNSEKIRTSLLNQWYHIKYGETKKDATGEPTEIK